MIAFSIPRAKFLLKEHYRADYLDSLNTITVTENNLCIQQSKNKDIIISNQNTIISNQEEKNAIQEEKMRETNKLLEDAKKYGKQQKRRKNLAIIAGSITTALTTYLWITK